VNGFLRRELLKHGYGEYADLVHWRDQAAAEAIMATAGPLVRMHRIFRANGHGRRGPSRRRLALRESRGVRRDLTWSR